MNDRTETISEQQVKEYLESVVAATIVPPKRAKWKYKRNEELVLRCGFPMEWKPLPETIAPVEPGFCYWNCQQLALANINLTYVERDTRSMPVSDSRSPTLGCSTPTFGRSSIRLGTVRLRISEFLLTQHGCDLF